MGSLVIMSRSLFQFLNGFELLSQLQSKNTVRNKIFIHKNNEEPGGIVKSLFLLMKYFVVYGTSFLFVTSGCLSALFSLSSRKYQD